MVPNTVRLALAAEAGAIATVQRRAWRQRMPTGFAAEVLDSITLDEMTANWESAIRRPPLAQLRVLVALGEREIVGFAALGPSGDPDADPETDGLIGEFVVEPEAQRRGHGSRLLHACVDTLVADGYTRASWWVSAADDALRGFLNQAGWAEDGAYSEVAVTEGGAVVKLVRLHTRIA